MPLPEDFSFIPMGEARFLLNVVDKPYIVTHLLAAMIVAERYRGGYTEDDLLKMADRLADKVLAKGRS